MDAYWITPKGEVLNVKRLHITEIERNPVKFGETKKSVQASFDKFDEPTGSEGKGREEIMTRVIRNGYIRIRERHNGWSIQLWKFTPKVSDLIWQWTREIWDSVRDKYGDVQIHELINGKLQKSSFKKLSEENNGLDIYDDGSEPEPLLEAVWVNSVDDLKDFRGDSRFGEYIKESSLSRVWKHNEKHDCGALTAFRTARNCGDGEVFSKKENTQRNKSLLAKLKSKGYGVTSLLGKYPEGGKDSKEKSFFVVDLEDTGMLEKDLKMLGAEFEQDSILFIPKGSVNNTTKLKAHLIGTNRCKNNWLGFGKTEPFAKAKIGYDSPIYTSYVNGRPFIFEGVGEDINNPGSGMGVWYMHRVANKHWSEIDE